MKKAILLFFLAAISLNSYAQFDSLSTPQASFSALIVKDMDQSISWYANMLGFSMKNKAEYPEMGFKQANLERGDFQLELIELDRALSLSESLPDYTKKTRVIGIFKIGFKVDGFDEWVQHLKTMEVDFHGQVVVEESTGKKMVILLDPDGNRIQLFEK